MIDMVVQLVCRGRQQFDSLPSGRHRPVGSTTDMPPLPPLARMLGEVHKQKCAIVFLQLAADSAGFDSSADWTLGGALFFAHLGVRRWGMLRGKKIRTIRARAIRAGGRASSQPRVSHVYAHVHARVYACVHTHLCACLYTSSQSRV